MKRSLFAHSLATIALFAVASTSIAVADPPPPPPLAVWSAVKETVDLELTCAGKTRKAALPAGTMVKFYNTGECRLAGLVLTPAGKIAIPARDFKLSTSKPTSTHVDRDGAGTFIFA